MTIEEVAAYIRVSERTVYEWVQKGDLPGGKLGNAWRFRRKDVENWVDRHLGGQVQTDVPAISPCTLSEILDPERVIFLEASVKQAVLQQLCDTLASSTLIRNRHDFEKEIFRREALMSTGIGMGVGIPHVRLDSVGDVVMALGIARHPLTDYASTDDIPVQIVCMVAARSTQHPHYIRALSAISSCLRDENRRNALISAEDPQTAYEIFTQSASQEA